MIKKAHAATPEEERMLRFIYKSSGIDTRYSVVPDFNQENGKAAIFYADEKNCKTESLENRLKIYEKAALSLSTNVIHKCIAGKNRPEEITHLITVSCTGMQAPGIDLGIIKALGLRNNIYRTSVNFMGCYAAIHGLKQAYYIAAKEPGAKVLVVCVELCTIHFQKEKTIDNITSTIIFSDGAAAVLVEGEDGDRKGWLINGFYSEINFDGITDMAWKISADGFLMTLSSKVPDILEQKCDQVINNALQHYGTDKKTCRCLVYSSGRQKNFRSY